MANITWADKDKDNLDGVHNKFRDSDANEVKSAVNSKYDAPASGKKIIVHCGDYDASIQQFPSGGGTGISGAIEQGNEFDIINGSVDPSLLPIGSTIRAKINAPGQIVSNWRIYAVVSDSWRSAYDASVNAYPSSGGSGTAGAIQSGDEWYISVSGDLDVNGLGVITVNTGALIKALVDSPGATPANWRVIQ